MSEPIRVVVVDDHVVVRQGIISFIEMAGGIEVVAQGFAGNHVLELVEEHRPDVLVTDLEMPASAEDDNTRVFQPITSLRKVIERYDVGVVVLTQDDSIGTIQSLADVGVGGYLIKSDNFSATIGRAIKVVQMGGTYFSPETTRVIRAAPYRIPPPPLTPRQLDVLHAIAQFPDETRSNIAARLSISENTLKKHVGAILDALQVTNMVSCVLKCVRMGVLDPSELQ